MKATLQQVEIWFTNGAGSNKPDFHGNCAEWSDAGILLLNHPDDPGTFFPWHRISMIKFLQ